MYEAALKSFTSYTKIFFKADLFYISFTLTKAFKFRAVPD